MYCFDTDVLSATVRRDPPMHLIRRLARTPPTEQCTTAITLGELVYGVQKRGSSQLAARVQQLIASAGPILPFAENAARRYGELRAELERTVLRVAEPDLRIAAIALARDAALVAVNVRHFAHIPGLLVENWLADTSS